MIGTIRDLALVLGGIGCVQFVSDLGIAMRLAGAGIEDGADIALEQLSRDAGLVGFAIGAWLIAEFVNILVRKMR